MKLFPCLAALAFVTPAVADEPHWSFGPVQRPDVPRHVASSSPIDGFLLGPLAERKLSFSPPAERAVLLRRVTLDLIGVPPTRAESHAFLNDASPDAYERVVDRLLADPRHGERWARHWMDVWRYSDWYGRRAVPDVMNSYPQIWRWRDWIVRSLNEDRGYDRMVQEMLAADELCPEDDRNVVATGFLVRNWFKWNYHQWMRDNVEHVGKAFLGLTFNCCHCHDHKYDPIPQDDYFRFRAFFEPMELRHDRVPGEPDPGPFKKYVYAESYGPIASGAIRVFDEKPDAPTFAYSGGDERNKVGDKPVTPGAPRFLGGDKMTIEPIHLPETSWYPGAKEFVRREELAKREAALASAIEDWRKLDQQSPLNWWGIRVARFPVLITEARLAAARSDLAQLQSRINADCGVTPSATAAAHERRFAIDEARLAQLRALAAVADARKVQAPNVAALEQVATAATAKVAAAHAALAKPSPEHMPLSPKYSRVSSGRRLALAKWITAPSNPLTARVAVNHLWGWYFARPIVESTFDFGRKGTKPSHPQLLDWLASELVRHDWKFKPLHRQIVLSAAYRQSSRGASTRADPDNRLLARFPTRRMDAEVVRDSLLAVAGELDATMGGREIAHEQGQTSSRRSLYFAHHGESKMAWLELFDAANPCDCYRRSTSVMPQQALALANSELAVRCGQALTRRLATLDDAKFVDAVFETVLSRRPTKVERDVALEFVTAEKSREGLVAALLNHNDFVTVR